MNYCDLHCDTPLELYLNDLSFRENSLNISAEKIEKFDNYVQLAAYCAPQNVSNDDGFEECLKVIKYFKALAKENAYAVCEDRYSLESAVEKGIPAFIITVEDARILNGELTRLDTLYSMGVRVLTLLWGGETCIGGSHESAMGLTPFGYKVAEYCAKLGIITDISHASEASATDMLNVAEKYASPIIASHSCSAEIHKHSRNLSDKLLRRLVSAGGIVGANTFPPHLAGNSASTDDIIKHITHYINTVGERHVAIGADFDGMGTFTEGVTDLGSIPSLRDKMLHHGFSDESCENIFFTNAYDFLIRNLK